MAHLWGDPRIGLRTSSHESVPTCHVRQQPLQKSIVLSCLVSLDVVSSMFVCYLGVSDTGMDFFICVPVL